MFERFSPHARRVVVLAQEQARDLHHDYLGPEHLLLGLLAEVNGLAHRILDSVGVTLDESRRILVEAVAPTEIAPGRHIPFTPPAKQTLEKAVREALALHHTGVGTEHLLLGLISVADGRVLTVLHRQDVEGEVLRQAVLDEIADRPPDPEQRRRQLEQFPRRPARGNRLTRTTWAMDEALDQARRYAGAEAVGSHHLLLAALTDRTSAAARALTDVGVDLEAARAALRAVDVTGTADELPELAGRRQMRLRLTDDALILEARDPVLLEQARATVAALRDTEPDRERGAEPSPGQDVELIADDLDVTVSLTDVWQALHLSLRDIRRRRFDRTPTPGPDDDDTPA